MLGILKAELVGHLGDALVRVEEHLLAERKDMLLDVDLRRQPRLLADEVAEISGRETGLVGEIGHRGQSVVHGLALLEVSLDVLLEGREDVGVLLVARDELSVVEPLAVVEDEFDAVGEDGLRVLVDGLLHLEADGPEGVGEHLPLALAEVERLGGVVVEEMVVVDSLAQRRAIDKVRREEEPLRVRGAVLLLLGHVDAHHLPWGEAHDGALLVVVFLAAVVQRALTSVLQPQGIEAVAQCDVIGTMVGGGVGDVHHAHQGVEGLKAIHLIILVDAVYGDYWLVCHCPCIIFGFKNKIFSPC